MCHFSSQTQTGLGWIDLVLDSEFLNQMINHWNQFLSVLQLPTVPGIFIFHA